MVKKFTIPFASQGDANDIPDALQVDGKVSFTQGFGYDYERPYDDPQAKDIAREDMNGLFKAITSAVGELQTLGASEWSNAISYPKGAIVYYEKDLYISQVDDNQNTPPQSWVSITSIANDSLKKAANLSDLTNKTTARSNLGLGSSATLNKTDILGTSTSLVATQKLVNDTKVNLENSINAIENISKTFLVKSNNLSDLTNKTTARNNLGLGSSATLNKTDILGTSSSLVATQKLVNDTKINLENSKQDKLTFTGTGNVARMSEVEKKRDLTNQVFDEAEQIKIKWHEYPGIVLESEEQTHTIQTFGVDGPLRIASRGIIEANVLLPTKSGTIALVSDIPAVSQSTGSSTTNVMSQKAVTDRLNAIESGHGLGYGQKWVDVTSQRVSGATYTNNTGKPIMVNIAPNWYNSTNDAYFLHVDNVVVAQFRMNQQYNNITTMSAIVPSGSSYKAIFPRDLTGWIELR